MINYNKNNNINNKMIIIKKKRGGQHCVLLISDKWYMYENCSLSGKFLLKETFLSFGRYNNFQLDNFH